jgi:aryl-alcohol dehydrogenase-like predicted oxidoreductase
MTTEKLSEVRELGRTGMRITPLGLGTAAFGGDDWPFTRGPQNDHESIGTIRRSIALGINWMDTAPVYGAGHAEDVVAQALEGTTVHPYVFTKVSMFLNPRGEITNSQKPETIRGEVDAILGRLHVDKIDLCQVHWPIPENEIEEGWRTLAELRDQGVIRHIGVSNFSVEQIERLNSIAAVETLQPQYSLVHPEAGQELLPYAKAHGIGVIIYSPMATGLLSGALNAERIRKLPKEHWRLRDEALQEPQLTRNLTLSHLLGEIGKEHGCSAGEVAIAWTLLNSAVTAAIVGARSPEQVDGLVTAANLRLSQSDIDRISTFLKEHP